MAMMTADKLVARMVQMMDGLLVDNLVEMTV